MGRDLHTTKPTSRSGAYDPARTIPEMGVRKRLTAMFGSGTDAATPQTPDSPTIATAPAQAPASDGPGPGAPTGRDILSPSSRRGERDLRAEVDEIRNRDPLFDIRRLADDAAAAFLRVQRAFAAQDAAAARSVLATALWEQARFQIEEYRHNGRRNVQEHLQIQSVRFIGARSRDGYDTVRLRLFTTTVDYDVMASTNEIVRGDKSSHPLAVDVMLERSSAAATTAEGGPLRNRCPHCAATLTLEWDGSCRDCTADVLGDTHRWVMAKITRLPDWDDALASCPPDILGA